MEGNDKNIADIESKVFSKLTDLLSRALNDQFKKGAEHKTSAPDTVRRLTNLEGQMSSLKERVEELDEKKDLRLREIELKLATILTKIESISIDKMEGKFVSKQENNLIRISVIGFWALIGSFVLSRLLDKI